MPIKEKKQVSCGIYAWEVVSGNRDKIGWKYIGQSVEVENRGQDHANELKKNKHDNARLQSYYNKYGKDSLKFSCLMKCPKGELDFWEKFFIKCFNSIKRGFNWTEGGNKPPIRYKKCRLANIYTGEIVTCNSIKEFAKKFNLNISSLAQLFRGEINSAFDWYNPKFSWRPDVVTVISPENIEYQIVNKRFREFCRKHNIKREGNFRSMAGGLQQYSQGWCLPKNRDLKFKSFFVDYKLVNPEGKLITGKNLLKLSRENNLNHVQISKVNSGKKPYYKGWTKYTENCEIKPFNIKNFHKDRIIRQRIFNFISPTNELFGTNNLPNFSKDHNLNPACLYNLHIQTSKSYKGWKKYKGESCVIQ